MKLFKKLAAIYAASYHETKISNYIVRWIKSSVHGVKIKRDNIGNIYIIKGEADTYPCVVAHLDQVQHPYPDDYKVVETSDIIFGYSPSQRERCGLGADDKCGIWIALKMLKAHKAIKVAFFVGEEVGCHGSLNADMTFFNDVRFVVEPDRRGAHDLITEIGSDICSKEFVDAIKPERFGYKPTRGMMTDVETLLENGLGVSCINLSCGYYSPHTEDEFVVKADMLNALEFVNTIIEECVNVYSFKYDRRYTAAYKGSSKQSDKFNIWGNTSDDESRKYSSYIHDDEYEALREYVFDELDNTPDMTADEILENWGTCFPSITIEDVEEIIEEYRQYALSMYESETDDEYWDRVCEYYGVKSEPK